MSKQYNKDLFGQKDVICGTPLGSNGGSLVYTDIKPITVNSIGGVGNVTIVLNFKLPSFDVKRYKLRQINYVISDDSDFLIKYYYDDAIFVPQTARDGYNIIGNNIASDIKLLPKSNVKNDGERIRMFTELQLNRGVYTVKAHMHKDGNWAEKPYTLEGYYLFELKK